MLRVQTSKVLTLHGPPSLLVFRILLVLNQLQVSYLLV